MKNIDKRIWIAAAVIFIIIISVILPSKIGKWHLYDLTPVNNPTPQFIISNPNTQSAQGIQISEAVDEIRKQTQFPEKIDDITTWTNISIELNQVVYDYSIDKNTDLTYVNESTIKPLITNWACSMPQVKAMFEKNITIAYRYKDYTGKTIAKFSIDKSNCI